MLNIKKRMIICISVGVVIALFAVGIIAGKFNIGSTTPAELLSLGEKYLSELNHEQALVQFLKAIEIEPMNERAYLGAAEAYIGLGQTHEAIAILEQGIAATDSEEMRARLLEMTESEDFTEPIEESSSNVEMANEESHTSENEEPNFIILPNSAFTVTLDELWEPTDDDGNLMDITREINGYWNLQEYPDLLEEVYAECQPADLPYSAYSGEGIAISEDFLHEIIQEAYDTGDIQIDEEHPLIFLEGYDKNNRFSGPYKPEGGVHIMALLNSEGKVLAVYCLVLPPM